MKKTILKKYAKLIANTGVAVKKGQDVFLYADLDQPDFVTMVVDELYKAGAKKVIVNFSYQPLTKVQVRGQSVKTLSTVYPWEESRLQYMAENHSCRLYLISEDPDGLKGVNVAKMMKGQQNRYVITKKYSDAMEGNHQWCIAAVPGAKWAKKVFPGETKSRAIEKLWEAILKTSRVTEENDPIEAWNEHNQNLLSRCQYLNSLNIETLEYHSSNGTNFRVGMIENAQFCGGGETTLQGNYFNPNIPTEECFISPKKGVAEGIVYSTKPLSYQGQLIENFSIEFKDGKVTEVKAEKNEDLLKKMVEMDEGAAYLGEVALVPFNSPINETGLLFYNTLFDENACCHLALGRGFYDTIKDNSKYTQDEMKAMGINDSIIHEDFMIGSADLSITAHCRDGKTVEIFKNGTWAF